MKRLLLMTWLAIVPSLYMTLSAEQIKLKDVSVREAIAAVGKTSNYSIVVKATSVDLTKKVSVDAADTDIESALSQIFAGQDVSWTIDGRNVSVTAGQPKSASPTETSPKKNVTGKVIDPDGEPLIGATLMMKGSSTGFITDVNGNFEIKGVTFPATFTVSYIGFNDMEVSFDGSEHDYAVVMSDFANKLEDVIVVGYGTQKRVNVTGAVSVISNDILEHRPVTNTAAAIQGADPSLLLTNRNGSIEGDEYSMAIRGTLSLNSGSPLVLVDGVEGSMTNLNPNDIESISVLKDASACAVYGAKASAGVVLITTKSGEAGVTKVSYNGRASISTNTTSTDFMTSAYDYVNLTNDFYRVLKGYNAWTFSDEQMAMLEARRYDVTEDPSRPWVFEDESGRYTWMYAANFDWYGYLFKRIRPETEHNVTVTGGNSKVKYYASGRYLYREGVFNANAADDLNSLSFRAKIDAEITKWLHYSNNISFSRSKYEYGGFAEQDGNTMTGAYGGAHSAFYNANQNIGPFYVPFNPDGSIVITPGFMADSDSQLGTGRVPAWMSDRNHNEKDKNSLVLMNRFVFDITKYVKFNIDYTYKRDDNLTSYRCLPVA
ncbi:MAG: SusC/RagA family TonB-linked outer membrane protein, partial [Bacteroidales bacterium]|nr:SusC/RagA family TonB-linked outer membrane protein [Bacteroidales bacterium]